MDTYQWIAILVGPVSAVIGWLAGTRIRRNNILKALQETINMLVGENKKTYEELVDTRKELVATRKELSEARIKIDVLETNQEKLFLENTELKRLVKEKK